MPQSKLLYENHVFCKVPYCFLIEILENQFQMKFETQDLRPFTYNAVDLDNQRIVEGENQFPVRTYKNSQTGDVIELVSESGLQEFEDSGYERSFYLFSNNPDLEMQALMRLKLRNIRLIYDIENSGGFVLERLKPLLEDPKNKYQWSSSNSSSEAILWGRGSDFPEFIKIGEGQRLEVSFAFPEEMEQFAEIHDLYSEFLRWKDNTEHSVPSLKKEALEKIGPLSMKLTYSHPVIQEYHEFMLKLGLKLNLQRN